MGHRGTKGAGEKAEIKDVMIVKKDNRRERFSKEKLKNGLMKACEKRPISIEKIDMNKDTFAIPRSEYRNFNLIILRTKCHQNLNLRRRVFEYVLLLVPISNSFSSGFM